MHKCNTPLVAVNALAIFGILWRQTLGEIVNVDRRGYNLEHAGHNGHDHLHQN